MELSYADKACVSFGLYVIKHADTRFFKQLKVMLSAITAEYTDGLFCYLAHDNQSFYGVAFLFATIPLALFF